MSVCDHVRLGYLFGRAEIQASRDGAEGDADEILEFVGLSAMSDLRAMDLTLANQKRLEVARALATQPELLLLDEVMAGLNPTEVAEAWSWSRGSAREGSPS